MSTNPNAVGVAFDVHVVGNVTGQVWPGTFRAKQKLTFRDKLNADRMRRELIGEVGGVIDPEAGAASLVISQLSVRLTDFPEWWKTSNGGLNLEDPNVLEEVYKLAMKVQEDYDKEIEAKGAAAQAALRGDKKD